MRDATAWVFVVDAGRGRLLRCSSLPTGRYHVDEDESIEDDWQPHEHGRPSPRAGRGGTSYASRSHESEERLSRFARTVADWLDGRTRRHAIERLDLFAPPRFLGAWRQACSPQLAERIREHEGDLAWIPAGELARHRALVGVLNRNGRRALG